MNVLLRDPHRPGMTAILPMGGRPRSPSRRTRPDAPTGHGDQADTRPVERPSFGLESTGEADARAGSRAPDDGFAGATRPLLGHLVAVARRILGDEDTAWDAVQEALLSLWLAGERPGNVRAWMVRAVVHRSLHLSRCRSRRRRHEDEARSGRLEESDRDDPARHLEREELRRTLREALLEIAPDHRSVLILSVVEQMDYESVAATLGVPIGTVRSRLNRSRTALREVLRRMLPDGLHGLS